MRRAAHDFPTWTTSVASMAACEHQEVRVICDACRECRTLDREALLAIAAVKGDSYSLLHRRCRCRLTPDCPGWNRFYYQCGVMRPFWDETAVLRWTVVDRARQDRHAS